MTKRILPVIAGLTLVLVAWLPTAASAQIVELGQTSTPIASPACPKGTALADCRIVLAHTTAIQTTSDGIANPTVVKKAGWIVAFTVGISNLINNTKTELSLIHGLDQRWGGTPQVVLTVLKPGPKNSYSVVSQSGALHLIPFLGLVVQEPLSLPTAFKTMTPLAVKPGYVIALTTPTWAPVLSYDLTASKFGYRQSRTANCTNAPAGQTAQTVVGSTASYRCSYTGTRAQYSATEVLNVPYPKKYVH
jgi:hypothetical protein